MGMLLLDQDFVTSTWVSITTRLAHRPTFQVVPDAAMVTIENVITAHHDEAWDRFPTNQKSRVAFWKVALLAAVPTESRGLFAVYFHEYIAASLRGDAPEVDDDTDVIVYSRRSVSAVAQRALAEAYQSTAAGLEGYTPEWNS